jgi:hypothetical protein
MSIVGVLSGLTTIDLLATKLLVNPERVEIACIVVFVVMLNGEEYLVLEVVGVCPFVVKKICSPVPADNVTVLPPI